jgi:Holliday junction resolvase RusA-like endonuclease
MSDVCDAMARLTSLVSGQSPDSMMAFVHPGAPVSKSRARMGKTSFYTPTKTGDAQKDLAWRFQITKRGAPALSCNVAIIAVFYRPNLQRIDTDNLMKLVLDAGTQAGVWRDDCQVSAHAALIELDAKNPRTVVAWCPYVSTLVRAPITRICQRCGKEYERPAWSKTGLSFCSGPCAQARRLVAATCPRCDQSFQRRAAGQVYCSMACRNASRGKRLPNGEQRPPATCEKCGGLVSKRGYRQCRACRGYGRPAKERTPC